ncbi:MAG: hypothetical protein HKO59_05265 [Phycisphaerales bacterium]|nr:hypothetical protein [Phycisphaerales bacterium]NNM25383.1 hypothetical protein [Phycisphaerales bacterium]
MSRVLMLVSVVLAGAATPRAVASTATEKQLAMQLWRSASLIMSIGEDVTVEGLQVAMFLAEEATQLDPDNVELWRYVVKLAAVAERDDAYDRAVREVVRLDPDDTAARLRRLNLALEKHQTVEARIAAVERLLDPAVRDRVGPTVASRLALDLALMHRRRGDLEAFADTLSTAVALDPANRAAAALAAGFFRMNVDDGFAEAELLTTLVLADPTDTTAQVALAELLLEHGAYAPAERLYTLAVRCNEALRRRPPASLMADRAVAMWGARHGDAAIKMIRAEQYFVDEYLRSRAFAADPKLGPMARARLHDHVHPTLATVRAAILSERGDEHASKWVGRALEVYDVALANLAKDDTADPALTARLQLEAAWVAVWLSDTPDRAETLLAEAETYRPLAATARARFDGWLALRRGDIDAALEQFDRVTTVDPATNLGRALAYTLRGERREAARALLQTARAEPGSLIGVWARNRLEALLGTTLPPTPEAEQLATLIDEVPTSLERYPSSPTQLISFAVEPAALSFKPYEPIIVNIIVTNNWSYPIGIDRNGPIRPPVLLLFSTSLGRIGENGALDPVVIDLDRRLRLEPYERLTIPVDLRRFKLGDVLASRAYRGTMVRIKGVMNFLSSPSGAMHPGLLGGEQWTPVFRVDGRNLDAEALEQCIAEVENPVGPETAVTVALLSQMVAITLPETAAEESHAVMERARAALDASYLKLDPVAQAWLLGALPRGQTRPAIREAALASENRLVRLMYLLFQLEGPQDPMLATALDSGDPVLTYVAARSDELFARIIEMNRLANPEGDRTPRR